MQAKTYNALKNFHGEMMRTLRKYVTHPDIHKLLFDLPGQRSFLPTCPDMYIEFMNSRFDFTSPGKCTINGALDLFDVEQEVLINDPYSLDMPVLGPDSIGVRRRHV